MKRLLPVWIALLILCAACGAENRSEGEYLYIAGQEVSREEVEFVLRMSVLEQTAYDGGLLDWSGTVDGQSMAAYVRDNAVEMAVSCHVAEQKAEEFDCALTDEEKAALVQSLSEMTGDKEAFDREIENTYGNIDLYHYYAYFIPATHEKLTAALFGKGGPYEPDRTEIESFYEQQYTNCAYLCLSKTDADGAQLSGTALETQRAVARALLKQAQNGADFLALIAEHGQDYMMLASPYGFPLPKGQFDEAFDVALAQLDVGQLSDVVETGDSLFVIQRLPPDREELELSWDAIREHCVAESYQAMLEQWCAEVEVRTTKAFDALDPKMYDAKPN